MKQLKKKNFSIISNVLHQEQTLRCLSMDFRQYIKWEKELEDTCKKKKEKRIEIAGFAGLTYQLHVD